MPMGSPTALAYMISSSVPRIAFPIPEPLSVIPVKNSTLRAGAPFQITSIRIDASGINATITHMKATAEATRFLSLLVL
jgi:hypothetical protein